MTDTKLSAGQVVDIIYRKANPISQSHGMFPPLEPGVSITDGVICERDVAVTLADGVTMYTDIYRPEGASNIPAIVAWSPYGKRAGFAGGNRTPGVPDDTISQATKFEGPDPYYWCYHGYAVINPDPRGVGNSQGDIQVCNAQEGRDYRDLVDFIGTRDWCNGKVGTTGNSWLGFSQYYVAAERPKHLACIAPWEGFTDIHRQILRHGGVPEVGFTAMLSSFFFGGGKVDDLLEMSLKYPFRNAYWDSKVPDLAKIEVPTYMTVGFSHFHLLGSVEAFNLIPAKNKWLRLHRDFEWPDVYAPVNREDLKLFFDRYLKGIRNGWDTTPRVRLDVMDRGNDDHVTRRWETEFPLARAQYKKLFLNAAAKSLSPAPSAVSSLSYDAKDGIATFDMRFDEDTELTGFIKLRLWVEAKGADDADLFVFVQKLDTEGVWTPTLVMNHAHPGAWGMLRVSHRELDDTKSSPEKPVLAFRREQKLKPGEIVPVDISIWPTSRFWHKGESLRVFISGDYRREKGWCEPFKFDVIGRGETVIHTGGQYDSHLLVPVIPKHRPVISVPHKFGPGGIPIND